MTSALQALVPLIVRPVPDLQSAGYHRHATLVEILRDELAGASPCNNVNEIALFFAVLVLEITVNRQREGSNCYPLPVCRNSGSRVATHERNPIQHPLFPPRSLSGSAAHARKPI